MNFVANVLFLRDSFKRGINLDFNHVQVQTRSCEKEFGITAAFSPSLSHPVPRVGPRPGRGRQSSPRGSGEPPPLLRRRPRPRSRILPRHSALAADRPKEEEKEEGGGTALRPLGRFGFRGQQNNGLGCLLGIYRFNLSSGKVTGAPGVASLDEYIVYRRSRRWHSSARPFATPRAQGQTEAEPSALLSLPKV